MKSKTVIVVVLVLAVIGVAAWFLLRKKPAVAAPAAAAPGLTSFPARASNVRPQPLPMAAPLAVNPLDVIDRYFTAGKSIYDAFKPAAAPVAKPTVSIGGADLPFQVGGKTYYTSGFVV
jgi:Flp pilus assembly protein CpaB